MSVLQNYQFDGLYCIRSCAVKYLTTEIFDKLTEIKKPAEKDSGADNDRAFISKRLEQLAYFNIVKLGFIRPG